MIADVDRPRLTKVVVRRPPHLFRIRSLRQPLMTLPPPFVRQANPNASSPVGRQPSANDRVHQGPSHRRFSSDVPPLVRLTVRGLVHIPAYGTRQFLNRTKPHDADPSKGCPLAPRGIAEL